MENMELGMQYSTKVFIYIYMYLDTDPGSCGVNKKFTLHNTATIRT